MKRSLTEAKVLRKLDIPDFRHMSKDKVVSFVSMLPQMAPEVAKCALEQFPAFAETGAAIIGCLKDSLRIVIDGNDANASAFTTQCQEALNALEAELARANLSDDGREVVINGILGIVEAMSQMLTEDRTFRTGLFRDLLTVAAIVVVCLAGQLGLRLNSLGK